MAKRTPIRHGEVLLLPVDFVPHGVATRVTRCIVGHSESGHHHVLESRRAFDEVITMSGERYVDLDAPTPLRHKKATQTHRELEIPSGAYKVLTKREWDLPSELGMSGNAPLGYQSHND